MTAFQLQTARAVWAHISIPGNERATVREMMPIVRASSWSVQHALHTLKHLGYIKHTGKLCRDRVVIVRFGEARHV
jgi:hypothetical protein